MIVPSRSAEPLASSVAASPRIAGCGPVSAAVGGRLATVSDRVVTALAPRSSVTFSRTVYVPAVGASVLHVGEVSVWS